MEKNKKDQQEDEVKVTREKFEIAIRDIKEVACFLDGLAIMNDDERSKFSIETSSKKLTNAIQWLNNWGNS